MIMLSLKRDRETGNHEKGWWAFCFYFDVCAKGSYPLHLLTHQEGRMAAAILFLLSFHNAVEGPRFLVGLTIRFGCTVNCQDLQVNATQAFQTYSISMNVQEILL